MTTKPGLRERKKERTRKALVTAAIELFGTKGYEETTIAELAEAADISTRTFFSYFASKEEVLFEGTPLKLERSASVLAEPLPGERPAELLLRSFHFVLDQDTDLTGDLAKLRTRLILSTPALQPYALRKVLEGQRELTRGLIAAYPGELDPVVAAAMTGALVGALVSTIAALLGRPETAGGAPADPEQLRAEMEHALRTALRGFGGLA
ncbi:TetR/AcrR family transcriptional regulator [Kitasatospora sp. NPDC048296]|uniref:TetR/AcrR family transcriptional regulator n=1 Tax=Kitasatospora sp. NPDC048296 TaxID=3364048 RepID=UPI0037159F10